MILLQRLLDVISGLQTSTGFQLPEGQWQQEAVQEAKVLLAGGGPLLDQQKSGDNMTGRIVDAKLDDLPIGELAVVVLKEGEHDRPALLVRLRQLHPFFVVGEFLEEVSLPTLDKHYYTRERSQGRPGLGCYFYGTPYSEGQVVAWPIHKVESLQPYCPSPSKDDEDDDG